MGRKGTVIWGKGTGRWGKVQGYGGKVQGYGERRQNCVTDWYRSISDELVAKGTGIWGNLQESKAKVQGYGEKFLISSEVFFVDLLHFSFYASLV